MHLSTDKWESYAYILPCLYSGLRYPQDDCQQAYREVNHQFSTLMPASPTVNLTISEYIVENKPRKRPFADT